MNSTKQGNHGAAEHHHSETPSRRGNKKQWMTKISILILSRTKKITKSTKIAIWALELRKESNKKTKLGTIRETATFILIFWLTQYCLAFTKTSSATIQMIKIANHSEISAENPTTYHAFSNKYETARIVDFYEKKYRLERAHLLKIISIAVENAQLKKISPFVILAIISHESNFVANAKNSSGATGLMQIVVPVHHNRFKPYGGPQNALKPEINIKIGTEILGECIAKMKSVRRGLRCYAGTVNGNDHGFSDYVLREATHLKSKSKK